MAAPASVDNRPACDPFPKLAGTPVTESDTAARFERVVTAAESLLDVAAVVCAVWFSYALYHALQLGQSIRYAASEIDAGAVIVAVIFVLGMQAQGAYQPGRSLLGVRETERVLRVTAQSFLVLLAVGMMSSQLISRWLLAIGSLLVPSAVLLERHLAERLFWWMRVRWGRMRRAVIYGTGPAARRLFSSLVRSPKSALHPVAFLEDRRAAARVIYAASYTRRQHAPVVSGPVTSRLLRQWEAQELIIASPDVSREKFATLAAEVAEAGVRISFLPHPMAPSELWVQYREVDGLLLATPEPPASNPAHELLKRILDITMGLTVLLLSLPLWLVIAGTIRFTSPGPVLFVHERVGANGKRFRLYKFRTMYVDAPAYSHSPSSPLDPRITRIGRYLRRTSLDELPQILNVLKGEMSLVGPRPEMPFIVDTYDEAQRQRLLLKPGITGLWQLSADRAYQIHENIEYDFYYLRHHNLFMDVAILLHTAIFAMRGI